MTPKTKTRITFDFDGDLRGYIEKLEQVICSQHWASGVNIFVYPDHKLLVQLIKHSVIVIDEREYDVSSKTPDSHAAFVIQSMLGKRDGSRMVSDMAVLFAGTPYEHARDYRNTLYLPDIKAYARADGIKPEAISEMLTSDECDKIIVFPYFPLDDKTAYYELTLTIEKNKLAAFLEEVRHQQADALHAEWERVKEQNKLGNRVTLRLEKKPDYETVEQITYRAFLAAEHASGEEALLARKLRSCPAFVPELDYVA